MSESQLQLETIELLLIARLRPEIQAPLLVCGAGGHQLSGSGVFGEA